MVLQCDQCKTRFRLDDAKIKAGGVKVRCSKCKHVFVVNKEIPQEEADFDSILSNLGSTVPTSQPTHSVAFPPTPPVDAAVRQEADPFAASEEVAVSASDGIPPETNVAAERGPAPVEDTDFGFREFAFNDEPVATPPADVTVDVAPSATDAGFEFDSFAFDPGEDMPGVAPASPGNATVAEFDADSFAFTEALDVSKQDNEAVAQEERAVTFEFPPVGSSLDEESAEGVSTSTAIDEEFSLGFEEDEVRGVAETENEASQTLSVGGYAQEEQTSDFVFTDAEPGLSSIDQGEISFPLVDENISPKEDESTKATENFDFEPIDFGEVTVQPTTAEEARGAGGAVGETDFAIAAAPEGKASAFVLPAIDSAATEEELPPLSISSRRKESSIFTVAVLAISLLVLLVLAGTGFFFLKDGPTAFNKVGLGFMAKWFGVNAAEEGSITARNPVGSFITNKEAGELFIISGEAVNGFKKPRATIQVKATLFGKNGAVVVQKSAYCGNQLSKEQLATLPMEKIEAAMNNQFGDSLSNLGVQAGKGIPFLIVFANVPKDIVEFGVEIAGSTVASQ